MGKATARVTTTRPQTCTLRERGARKLWGRGERSSMSDHVKGKKRLPNIMRSLQTGGKGCTLGDGKAGREGW